MGYNAAVMFLMDSIDLARKDPAKFVDDLIYAIQTKHDFIAHRHDCGTAFHLDHADSVRVYAIGGNCVSELKVGWHSGDHHTKEGQVKIVKKLAEELGYKLVKKAKQSPNPESNPHYPKGIT